MRRLMGQMSRIARQCAEWRTRIDDLDRNILSLLQQDSSLALDEIARRVGASKTPVWNRIRKMKASGLIRAEVAMLDPEKLGLESCFFVLIRTSQHDADWLDRFLKAVQSRPEVMEAHRLAGDIDYILKVRVPNARAYDAFYRALIKEVSIFNVTSTLSMEEIKNTTALPVAADAASRTDAAAPGLTPHRHRGPVGSSAVLHGYRGAAQADGPQRRPR